MLGTEDEADKVEVRRVVMPREDMLYEVERERVSTWRRVTGRVDGGCTGVGGARGLGDELVGVEGLEGLEGGTGMSFSERGRFGEVGMMRLIRPDWKKSQEIRNE